VGDVPLQLLGEPQVVVVDEGDEVAPGARDPEVPGPARPAVRPTEDLDARIADPLAERGAAVRAPVVDDEELEPGVRLRQDRVDGLDDVLL